MTRATWIGIILVWIKKAVIGFGILGVLVWLVWVSTVQATKVKGDTISDEQEFEKTEITEPIGYGYREGALLWRLTGLKAVEVKETQKSTINRIYEMTFYKEGEPNLYASGDAGYWDKSREKLILKGNVRCESADGTTLLLTEEMIWFEKTEVIECPKPIDLWVEDNHITSDALYSDRDMVVLDFIGNVKMFVVGLEGESFVTKEEVFPLDSVGEREKSKKGINVECEYLFYNKETKYIRCYPKIPRTIISKHKLTDTFRPVQHELQFDPRTGQIKWAPPEETDGGFEEGLAGIEPVGEDETFEVVEISEAMGWGDTSTDEGIAEIESSLGTDEETEQVSEGEGENGNGQMLIKSSDEYMPGRIFMHQDEKEKKIWCDFMEMFLDEKKIKSRGNVRYEALDLRDEDRPPRGKIGKAITSEYTWVDANYMNYFWDDEVVDAWGNVRGWQDEKEFTADNMTHSDVLGIVVAYGDVIVEQFGGRWLEEHEILEDIKDEDAKEDAGNLPKFTRIPRSHTLTRTGHSGGGDVLFEQESQKIRGKRVEYDDSMEVMVMYDEVQFKNEEGEWMLADKLTMDYYLENYLIEGAQSKVRVLLPRSTGMTLTNGREKGKKE